MMNKKYKYLLTYINSKLFTNNVVIDNINNIPQLFIMIMKSYLSIYQFINL